MTGPLAASLAVQQRRVDAVAVAAVAQLAVELVDQVAAVGEDQDAAGPRGLDEPERGHRLAGAGGVLEPEAPVGVGILGLLVELDVLVELVASSCQSCGSSSSASPVLELVLVARPPRPGSRPRRAAAGSGGGPARAPLRRAVAVALGLGQQRGQRARQRVDLVGREHRAVGQVRLLLGEQPLEPEQQRELPAPLDRRLVARRRRSRPAQRRARGAAGRARRQRVLEGLALVDELLAREELRARDRGRIQEKGWNHPYGSEGCVS